jgi:CelD/BcsL family acetyltransferase involved in cellulose biosynthesis
VVLALRVERIQDAAALAPIREDWNRLVDQSARPNVFLTWEWLEAWWTHFGAGQRLHVIVVRDARGAVVGVGPFCIERLGGPWPARVLKFLGTKLVSSDYLDVLAAPGLEREVSAAVLHALREDRGVWDLAELSDLLEDSVGLGVLGGEARATRCAVGVSTGEWCPYLPLAATREEYFDSLGRSKRSRLKRARKAVEGVGCAYTLADRPEALGPALEALFVLHAKRWAARGLTGNLHDPAVRAFHHRLAGTLGSQGSMRIYTLEREGKPVACDYVLQRGKTVYFYQTAYDPDPAWEEYKPGYTLLAHTLEDSVDRGAREFDFLRGREEYKDRWTSSVRETWRLTVVPREHLAALARYRGGQAFRWVKRRIKGLISGGKR